MAQGNKDGEIGQVFQPALGSQQGEVPEHGGLASAGVAQHSQVVESDQGLFGRHGPSTSLRAGLRTGLGFALDRFTFPDVSGKFPPSPCGATVPVVLPDLKGDVECLQVKGPVLSPVEGFDHVQNSERSLLQLGHKLVAVGGGQGLSPSFGPEPLGLPNSQPSG